MRSVEGHRHQAKKEVKVGIITVSSSRARAAEEGERVNDESGETASRRIREFGFRVTARRLVPDDVVKIRLALLSLIDAGLVDVVVLLGGTGIASSDVTPEAVEPLYEKTLIGFGEAFRSRSFKSVGSAAMMSRASAGVIGKVLVACFPGSPDGVSVGLGLLLEELPHLISIARQA